MLLFPVLIKVLIHTVHKLSKLCKSDKFIHFYIVVSLFFDKYIYMHIWRQMQYLFDHLKDTCINYHLIACKYMHVYLPLTVIETPDVKAKSTRISDGCPRTILLRLGF